MPRKRMSTIERGARLTIGHYIGRQIIKVWQGFVNFVKLIIAIWLMFYIGDAIKKEESSKQRTNQVQVSR